MGVRHVVMIRWREDSTAEQVAAAVEALRTWGVQAADYGRFTLSTDAGIDDGNHDVVAMVDLPDRDAYAAYRDDPRHRAMIAEYILPILANRSAIQYENQSSE